MTKPDNCCDICTLRHRLAYVRRKLHEAEGSVASLVSREWLKDSFETRMCELENQIVIRVGVDKERE